MKTLGEECKKIYESLEKALEGIDEETRDEILSDFKFVSHQLHEALAAGNGYEKLLEKNGIIVAQIFPQWLACKHEFETDFRDEWSWLYDNEE